MADDTIRGTMLNGSRMINQMRWNHELGILETLVLGHAYMGACLMAAGLKGEDRLALQVDCSGPVKGLVVEANAAGEVRGFLKNVPIPVEKTLGKLQPVSVFRSRIYIGDPHAGRCQTDPLPAR
jgi:molecular chaperone Hsp33